VKPQSSKVSSDFRRTRMARHLLLHDLQSRFRSEFAATRPADLETVALQYIERAYLLRLERTPEKPDRSEWLPGADSEGDQDL
jgi:hypothetical protein